MSGGELLREIQAAVRRGDWRFTVHGAQEATAERIGPEQIRSAIISEEAELIEDYPDDPRGPSCLVLSWTADRRPIHVVVAYPPDVAVITVYVPDHERWDAYRRRR